MSFIPYTNLISESRIIKEGLLGRSGNMVPTTNKHRMRSWGEVYCLDCKARGRKEFKTECPVNKDLSYGEYNAKFKGTKYYNEHYHAIH